MAQALQPAHGGAEVGLAVALLELLGAEVAVRGAVAQDVVGDDQDGVADRHRGLLRAQAAGEPPVLGAEVGLAAAPRGLGRLDQGGAEPGAALAGAAAQAVGSENPVTPAAAGSYS